MKKILYIGNKLSSHGLTVTSIETLGTLLEKEGFKLYFASSKKNKAARMLDMFYKTILHSKKVDYVLIDTYSTSNFWYAVIVSQICRLLNVNYIPNLHGGDLPNRLKNNHYLSKLIFRNAFVNIAPSRYLFETFQKAGYTNVKYIPNTIEIDNYPFQSREYDYPRLLWVRSFAKIYNPILAVKVLIEVKKKYPNAILTMVGPKKDESFEETVQFAKESNVEVTFTGRLSKKEWITLSTDFNVFINTTHFDNTPVSVIEAMALGLPVISTNVGGIPYLLTHNQTALLVADDDLKDMVHQIDRLFEEKELANSLSLGAKKMVDNFDWEIVKKEWKSLLK
ncbi:glycosyltransferase family 4 protein [Flavobacterium solisilvae]|uniref:Glycosyltransferase family 4 protein n=1 Tax=Flavobacterium solisilvae TaxID=1852019 RepID=A0ABX1QWW0_9FLAO|nr:glycosyltransferase family 4 protein [Flavobacterium solisilvae]NMH25314.1 glycosyltransferase family 4 protein [Flavobacterium solisilvae]